MATEIFVPLSVNYAENRKVRSLVRFGRDARALRDLFVQLLCYCKRNLTDGFVPVEEIGLLVFPDPITTVQEDMARLISVGLVEETEGGYMVPGFLERNKSRDEVKRTSESRSVAGRRGGVRSGQSRRAATRSADTHSTETRRPSRSASAASVSSAAAAITTEAEPRPSPNLQAPTRPADDCVDQQEVVTDPSNAFEPCDTRAPETPGHGTREAPSKHIASNGFNPETESKDQRTTPPPNPPVRDDLPPFDTNTAGRGRDCDPVTPGTANVISITDRLPAKAGQAQARYDVDGLAALQASLTNLSDSSGLDPRIDMLVSEITKLRPGWDPADIRQALTDDHVRRDPFPELREGALAITCDPETRLPKRIIHYRTYMQSRDYVRDLPPWCGHCDNKQTRWVETPDGTLRRCPTCWSPAVKMRAAA